MYKYTSLQYVGKFLSSLLNPLYRRLQFTRFFPCTKTAFSFDSNFYEQTDGVSMGCLARVLANVILTEFEKAIVNYVIKTGIITFYRRYVDDVLIKPKDIPFVLDKFKSFEKNLKFTVDNFENG